MIRLLALTTMLCLLSTPALGGKVYKWVDENGKMHFTDDINKIPSKARSKVKDLFNKTSGKTASDDAASRDPSNAKPATKAEKADFLKRIKAKTDPFPFEFIVLRDSPENCAKSGLKHA